MPTLFYSLSKCIPTLCQIRQYLSNQKKLNSQTNSVLRTYLKSQTITLSMSSDDYQVQNIYRYTRKSYKHSKQRPHDDSLRDTINLEATDGSPRSDRLTVDSPGCSCDLDPEAEIANILHKKCPVITLAQQQLQKLLDETDKLLCDNTRCCRFTHFILIAIYK